MVLGESHYSTHHEVGSVVPDMTEWVVREYLDGDARPAVKRFCTVVADTIRSVAKEGATSQDIWRSIVFYNYVPVVLADGPRKQPPTLEQWNAGRGPFFEVIRECEVEAALVLGGRLWDNMEASHDPPETFLLGKEERWMRRYYLHGSAERSPYRTLTASIPHPTGSFGFSADRWSGVAKHLRDRAIEERRRTGTPLEGLAA
jgi:hypothetical protein